MRILAGNREFVKLFAIGGLQSVARWLELLAFGIYVFDLTGSPLMVTMVTLVKFAPLALFGIPFGVLTGFYPARSIYIVGLSAMILVNLFGVALALQGVLTVNQVLMISFTGGLFWVLDFPVRRALIGDAVEEDQLGGAMAIDTIANNGTRMLGPIAGGALLQFVGLSGAFFVAILIYLACLVLNLRLGIGHTYVAREDERISDSMLKGLRFVNKNRMLLAFLLITVAYNLFGFPLLSLVPVLGRDSLHLSASMVGLLASMEGLGALIGSMLVLWFGSTLHFRRIYTGGLLLYFMASLAYAWMDIAIPVALSLIFAGIGSAAFAAMQTTLLILNSTAEYRGRIFGLLSLSIGTGLVGFIFIGVMANSLGVRTAIFISSVSGILATIAIVSKWPAVVAPQRRVV